MLFVADGGGGGGRPPSVTHMPFATMPFVEFFLLSAVVNGSLQGRATGGPSFPVSPADLGPGGGGTYKLAHEWDARGEQFGSDNGLFFICIPWCLTPATPLPPPGPYSDSFISMGTGPGKRMQKDLME